MYIVQLLFGITLKHQQPSNPKLEKTLNALKSREKNLANINKSAITSQRNKY